MKPSRILLIASTFILIVGATSVKAFTEERVLIVESEEKFDLASLTIPSLEYVAVEVLTNDAPKPGILEVLPTSVVERPYDAPLRQNRAPPDKET